MPDAVLAAIQQGQHRGELAPDTDPSAAAEVLTAVYFDTLSAAGWSTPILRSTYRPLCNANSTWY